MSEPPICRECGCTTGGGEYCYEHVPYLVYPLKDGSFLSDRWGRRHIWLSEPPSFRVLWRGAHRRAVELEQQIAVLSSEVTRLTLERDAAALWKRAAKEDRSLMSEQPKTLRDATEELRQATDRLLAAKDVLDTANAKLAAENARAQRWLADRQQAVRAALLPPSEPKEA